MLRPAQDELLALPLKEQAALRRAIEKLTVAGPGLGYPHSSAVQISPGWRELRPRRGRSRWRALYRRVGDRLVVAAVGPEAGVDPSGFERMVRRAGVRLARWQEDRADEGS